MMPVSLQQMPPVARPAFNGDTAPGRVHYLPGPIPTIEQILMKQACRYAATGNEADNLLNALKQDNHNMEVMLSQLAALAGIQSNSSKSGKCSRACPPESGHRFRGTCAKRS